MAELFIVLQLPNTKLGHKLNRLTKKITPAQTFAAYQHYLLNFILQLCCT